MRKESRHSNLDKLDLTSFGFQMKMIQGSRLQNVEFSLYMSWDIILELLVHQ